MVSDDLRPPEAPEAAYWRRVLSEARENTFVALGGATPWVLATVTAVLAGVLSASALSDAVWPVAVALLSGSAVLVLVFLVQLLLAPKRLDEKRAESIRAERAARQAAEAEAAVRTNNKEFVRETAAVISAGRELLSVLRDPDKYAQDDWEPLFKGWIEGVMLVLTLHGRKHEIDNVISLDVHDPERVRAASIGGYVNDVRARRILIVQDVIEGLRTLQARYEVTFEMGEALTLRSRQPESAKES